MCGVLRTGWLAKFTRKSWVVCCACSFVVVDGLSVVGWVVSRSVGWVGAESFFFSCFFSLGREEK